MRLYVRNEGDLLMKVIFYCSANNSDVYEFPDDATELELFDAANEWVADNVGAWYEVIDEED